MSSPALLLNSAVPATSMNSLATGVPASTGTIAGAPGVDNLAAGVPAGTGEAFLTSFMQLMQQASGSELIAQDPALLPVEGEGLSARILADFSVEGIPAGEPADGLEIPVLMSEMLSGDGEESLPLPLSGEPLISAQSAHHDEETLDLEVIASGDVILTNLPGLPPLAAQEDVNPTAAVGEHLETSAVLIPIPPAASSGGLGMSAGFGSSGNSGNTADFGKTNSTIAAAEPLDAGRRLDLTQWLSRTNIPSDGDPTDGELSGEPNTWATGTITPVQGDADALLKNALFARAMPAADTLSGFDAMELDISTTLDVAAKPVTAQVPAPMTTEIVNNGRITIPLNLSFGHPQWSEALAERTGWLAHQRIHSADMQLDPPELGPLQVKISVHQDQAVVSFVSANPQVRDLLDQNLTRLRDLLQEQGLQLVDAGVSDQRQESGENSRALTGDAGDVRGENSSSLPEAEVQAKTQVAVPWGVDDFV